MLDPTDTFFYDLSGRVGLVPCAGCFFSPGFFVDPSASLSKSCMYLFSLVFEKEHTQFPRLRLSYNWISVILRNHSVENTVAIPRKKKRILIS
jgi:hypothetical protein